MQIKKVMFFIGVWGKIDLGGTGVLSRQDWVEVCGVAASRAGRPPANAESAKPMGALPIKF